MFKFLGIGLVLFLIVSLTPAYAVQLSTIEDMQKDSSKIDEIRKGSILKIFFSIPKLIKILQKLNKNTKNLHEELKDINSEIEFNEVKGYNPRLHYSNMVNNAENNTNNIVTDVNNTENNTNNIVTTVNNTENNTNTVVTTVNSAKNEAKFRKHALHITKKLSEFYKGISISITKKDVNELNTGDIIQIVNKNGYLRYWMVKDVYMDNGKKMVKLYNNGPVLVLSYDYLIEHFTGITLNTTDQNVAPEAIVSAIFIIQKQYLLKAINILQADVLILYILGILLMLGFLWVFLLAGLGTLILLILSGVILTFVWAITYMTIMLCLNKPYRYKMDLTDLLNYEI